MHPLTLLDVDEGSTVTDFLRTERARGVTIQSAAISFHWPPLENDSAPVSPRTADFPSHNVNLIDTPGHADFTFEVLRSLRILDGAVCILDGVAGVEAQTEKVWYQAAKYRIPKIIYVNKLDRDGAAFGETVRQIAGRLHTYPAVCHVPWWQDGKGQFCGIGDAIGLRAIRWLGSGDGTNYEIITFPKLKEINEDLHAEVSRARKALIEILAENDDQMVEKYLDAEGDSLAISSADVVASIRRCLLTQQSNIVPVFAGASFRNMGVQLLLDAIVELLPSPAQAFDPEVSLGSTEGNLSDLLSGKLLASSITSISKKSLVKFKKPSLALIENLDSCALAFKVVHDPRRGVLVYVRTYFGSIQRQSVLFNTNLQVAERAPQLLKMYASESVHVDSIPAGQIGVIPGLKYARTGDTLISYKGASPKTGLPAPLNSLQLRPIEVPPAVFFSSIEPHSLSEQKATQAALEILVREDPSLKVTEDEETGQTLLSGMGEFHLEIAQDRLVNDLKAKASMGDIEIAYREAILGASSSQRFEVSLEQGLNQGRAACAASIFPISDDLDLSLDLETDFTTIEEGNRITFTIPATQSTDETEPKLPIKSALPPHLSLHTIHNSIKNGALAALGRGIIHPFRLHDTHVHLTLSPNVDLFGSDTTPSALSSAARFATKQALKASTQEHGAALLELVMNVSVSVGEENLGATVNDLSSNRGGNILSLDNDGDVDDAAFETRETGQGSKALTAIPSHKVYFPPDPFAPSTNLGNHLNPSLSNEASNPSGYRTITARVPLKEMVGYLKHLRSLTGGRGTFVMSPYRFERVTGVREKAVLRGLRGDA